MLIFSYKVFKVGSYRTSHIKTLNRKGASVVATLINLAALVFPAAWIVVAVPVSAQPVPKISIPTPNNDPSKGDVWREVQIIVPTGANEMYQSIGVIPSRVRGKGALGTMLNGCLLVAPRHAVTDPSEGDVDVSQRTARFQYGYTGDVNRPYFRNEVTITPVVCGNVSSSGDYSVTEDYCVFKTERVLSGELPKITIGTPGVEVAKKIVNAAVGFTTQSSAQMNGQYALGVDRQAFVQGGTDNVFAFNAVISSGTPLIADVDGANAMVAMAVTFEYAVPMSTVMKAVRSVPAEKRRCRK